MEIVKTRDYQKYFLIVLVVSLCLRVALVFSGGQDFWPDESRYHLACKSLDLFFLGDIKSGLVLLHDPDHILFKIIAMLPGMIQKYVVDSVKVPALFFSLFSVLNLWLTWKIVRRLGENQRVALFAVILLSLCATFLYYSRHLFPYDIAMTFGLLGLFFGLRKIVRAVDLILAGFLLACLFLTYNGSCLLVGAVMCVLLGRFSQENTHKFRKMFIFLLAFTVPLMILFVMSRALGGDLLGEYVGFARSVNQGGFSEGWSFPFFFLWDAEHSLVLLWGVALMYGVKQVMAGNRKRALLLGLGAVVIMYSSLVIFSVFLHKFVVCGRFVRQMVPFLCILSAVFLGRMWHSSFKRKKLVKIIFVVTILQAIVNFYQPFVQVFPRIFIKRAVALIDQRSLNPWKCNWFFAHHIYPEPSVVNDSGKILLRESHPLQFVPYQYEGYTPEQRKKFQSMDISMRLVITE